MNYIHEIQSLSQYGNVPITANVLNNMLCNYKAPKMKIQAMVRDGIIIRIKKDLYVVSPEISKKPLSPELIANHLYGPSYVSLHYALSYYGLIPERVVTVTSATTMHTQTFQTSIGRFTFRNFADDYFPIGVTMATEGDISYMIASPEKALCDMIMVEHHVPSQSLSALEVFFEEDMRIELDDLKAMDCSIIKQCMEVGKKKTVLANLLKLMER